MNDNAAAVIGGLSLLLITGSLLAWGAIFLKLRKRESPVPFSPRLPVPWTSLDLLVLVISFLFFEMLAANVAHSLGGGGQLTELVPYLLAAQAISHLVWFALATAYLIARGAYLDDFGFDNSHLSPDLKVGVWLFLAASVPVLLVQLFFTKYLDIPSQHPLLELTQHQPSLAVMVLATVAAVGIAPWFEEFVFRVLLQGWLEAEQVRIRNLRNSAASDRPGFGPLIVASVLFAGLHAEAGPDPAAIFVLSLFLGYAYRQTHRVLPSIVIHVGVNGWTMLNMWIMYLGSGSGN